MPSIEELATQQDDLAFDINRAISTIRKTPKERRTPEYYEKKASELALLWRTFEKTDNKIRRLPNVSEDHPYFKSGLLKVS